MSVGRFRWIGREERHARQTIDARSCQWHKSTGIMGNIAARLRQISPVYEVLARAAETIPGWTPLEQLLALYVAAAFDQSVSGDIVEVGSWCGRSTVALALAAKHSGRRLHAVDIFPELGDWVQNPDKTWSIKTIIGTDVVESYNDHTAWEEPFQQTILPVYADGSSPRRRLEDALEQFGLRDIVAVHRATGALFRSAEPSLRIGLLFLDADHGEAAVRADIEGFLPMMQPGGVMCFDDAFTVYDGVDRAITQTLINRVPPVMKYGCRVTRKMYVARLAG